MFEPMELTNDAVIKVIGVGGGGGNAVEHMVRERIEGVHLSRMPDATLIASYQAYTPGVIFPTTGGKNLRSCRSVGAFASSASSFSITRRRRVNGDIDRHQTAYAMRWRQPPARSHR